MNHPPGVSLRDRWPAASLATTLNDSTPVPPGTNVTDALGHATTYTYDGLNHLKTATDAAGTTHYTYDSAGNLLTLIDADGKDASDNVLESHSYDATGNRTNTGYNTTDNNRLQSDGVFTYT